MLLNQINYLDNKFAQYYSYIAIKGAVIGSLSTYLFTRVSPVTGGLIGATGYSLAGIFLKKLKERDPNLNPKDIDYKVVMVLTPIITIALAAGLGHAKDAIQSTLANLFLVSLAYSIERKRLSLWW